MRGTNYRAAHRQVLKIARRSDGDAFEQFHLHWSIDDLVDFSMYVGRFRPSPHL
jgi:hypothetical protein